MAKVAMMGSGSWGTTFAAVLADAGSDITMWGRDPEIAAAVNSDHMNPVYHP